MKALSNSRPNWKVGRREFIKTGLAGLGYLTASGIPGKTFAQAPALIKGTRLTILQASYFIAPAQELYKSQAQKWGRDSGVSVMADFINWPDVQSKVAAAIYGGGIDIAELWPGWNFLYRDNLVDMTEEAEEVGRRGGGFEPYVLNSARVNGRYLGIPHGQNNNSVNYRISWFKDAGVPYAEDGRKLDFTWDEYHAIVKKCRANGHPAGQALGHSMGDPPCFCYPYLWSYGAMEVDRDGKTVLFNKPEFVDGMKSFIQAWNDGYDKTGTSWDDSNNNRAFLAGQLSATINASSIYFAAKKDRPEIAQDMNHMLFPKGPAGRFYWLGSRTFGILKSSRNIPAAREFLKWWFQDEQYGEWLRLQDGYQLATTKKYADDPMWDKDPKMSVFRDVPKFGRDIGYAGPANEKASLAFSKYIVVDTFARAVQSGDALSAIRWGAEQLQRIYGG